MSNNEDRHDGATSSSRYCFCTYGCTDELVRDGISYTVCESELNGACYYMKRFDRVTAEEYNEWGCLHLEVTEVTHGSPMQCNGHLAEHYDPTTISCCYTDDLCNLNNTLPPLSNAHVVENALKSSIRRVFEEHPALATSSLILALIVLIMSVTVCVLARRRNKPNSTTDVYSHLSKSKTPLLSGELPDISSGHNGGELNAPTIASGLKLIEMVGRGRYGEVHRASWKGETVAVKIFFTWEEASWRREVHIYMTDMLNHDNILGFIAADIASLANSTSMLVITSYHKNGSLHDYLKRDAPLQPLQALRLAQSSIEGLRYLHQEIVGHNCRKPAIAHRDIKSRNILVKADHMTACIADFGLAIKQSCDGGIETLPGEMLNIQVGTRRYMSPEVLNGTISVHSFDAFKMSDVYSWALVLWEITCRVDICGQSTSAAPQTGSASSQSSGYGTIMGMQPIGSLEFPPQSRQYLTPFEDQGLPLKTDPSIEMMRDIVCTKRLRPITSWTNVQNPPHWLLELSRCMRTCWSHNASARLSAIRIKLDLDKLVQEMMSEESEGKISNEKIQEGQTI